MKLNLVQLLLHRIKSIFENPIPGGIRQQTFGSNLESWKHVKTKFKGEMKGGWSRVAAVLAVLQLWSSFKYLQQEYIVLLKHEV